jgi:hypothetical protein
MSKPKHLCPKTKSATSTKRQGAVDQMSKPKHLRPKTKVQQVLKDKGLPTKCRNHNTFTLNKVQQTPRTFAQLQLACARWEETFFLKVKYAHAT